MEYVDDFKPEFEISEEEEFSSDPSLGGGYPEDDIIPFEDQYGDDPYGRQAGQNEPQYYANQYGQPQVPELLKQFVIYLHKYIKERKIYDIQSMYEQNFNKITERYFKQTPWPPAEYISALVNHDPLTVALYKDLTYRHIYSKMLPSLEQRFESWKNYCELFNIFLNGNFDAETELPNQWLWDMIDEFIYQFQSFCQYRSKLKNKTPEELSILVNNPQVWNTTTVINYLQSLITKSRIVQTLEKEKQGLQEDAQQFPLAQHPVYKMLGYFSLIGLMRVQCLLGDYHLALKTVAPIDVNTRGLLTKVTACHVTFFYYLGFIYMMMRRYVDSIKTFSNILLYINRIKQYNTRSSQYDQLLKKNEQMYGLLSMCLVLCPQRVDENVHSYLREKYSDKTQRMQKGGDDAILVFEEIFAYACPKFINPAPPSYALVLEDPNKYPPSNFNQEPLKLQSKLFLNEVKQQTLLPTIRSFLKLYTTIGTNKLSKFLETDENTFRTQLLCYKHKMRGLQWTSGSPLGGDMATSSDVDFFIDQDMVHIHDTKVQRKYSEFFIRHINKFESIITDLATSKVQ